MAGTTPGAIPLVNVGGSLMDAQFESLEFAQKILAAQNRAMTSQKERERQEALVDT